MSADQRFAGVSPLTFCESVGNSMLSEPGINVPRSVEAEELLWTTSLEC